MGEAMPGGRIEDRSLGELVALASSNVSDLVRAEIELAKLELKSDAKKAAWGGMMFSVAGLIAGLVLILLSIAAAYGLVALGMWHWAAFLTVAGFYTALALLLLLIGYRRIKKIDGAKRTLRTLKDDVSLLRRRGDSEITASDAKALTD